MSNSCLFFLSLVILLFVSSAAEEKDEKEEEDYDFYNYDSVLEDLSSFELRDKFQLGSEGASPVDTNLLSQLDTDCPNSSSSSSFHLRSHPCHPLRLPETFVFLHLKHSGASYKERARAACELIRAGMDTKNTCSSTVLSNYLLSFEVSLRSGVTQGDAVESCRLGGFLHFVPPPMAKGEEEEALEERIELAGKCELLAASIAAALLLLFLLACCLCAIMCRRRCRRREERRMEGEYASIRISILEREKEKEEEV